MSMRRSTRRSGASRGATIRHPGRRHASRRPAHVGDRADELRIIFFGRLSDGAAQPAAVPARGVRDTDALRAWLGDGRPELLDPSVRIAVNDEMILGARRSTKATKSLSCPR